MDLLLPRCAATLGGGHMCEGQPTHGVRGSDDDHPNPESFSENLRQRMPMSRKIHLVVRNNTLKLARRKPCCGNHGEPGC